MSEDQFVEVYRAKNSPQAFALKQVLEEAGIRVVVENDLLQGVVGELPMGWATAPRIKVASGDVPGGGRDHRTGGEGRDGGSGRRRRGGRGGRLSGLRGSPGGRGHELPGVRLVVRGR
jgi:hypothetical protein